METIASKLLGEYGMLPLFALMVVILWFFLREIKKEVSGVKKSMEKMTLDFTEQIEQVKAELLARLRDLESRSDKQDEEMLAALHELQDEIKYIEREYVRREDHYKDLGGWRTDFRALQDRMDALQNLINSIWERMSKWKT